MKERFLPRHQIPLLPGTTYERPPEQPELVRLINPAVDVMTDFTYVHPVTTDPDMPIDNALELMKTAGVRLLLVTNEQDQIIGLITARDIQGEKPIRQLEETRTVRSSITVEMIMTRQSEITVLDMRSVQDAEVGHIIETLKQLERQHILVVEVDDNTGGQRVRGMFSTSQISKNMLQDISQDIPAAHSLAEIVHDIG
ncbi:MAG: CBS domain-containing protein [Gammaproteobacteria bacterium]|nr:CBS domain-containing protein [Gammaproteobacteria bacterium]